MVLWQFRLSGLVMTLAIRNMYQKQCAVWYARVLFYGSSCVRHVKSLRCVAVPGALGRGLRVLSYPLRVMFEEGCVGTGNRNNKTPKKLVMVFKIKV